MVIMAVNKQALIITVKFALIVIGLLMLVYVIALITPWLARKIDNLKASPARVKKGFYDFDKDELRSVYDPQQNENENGDESLNGKGQ